MLSTGYSIQDPQKRWTDRDIPCKWEPKESRDNQITSDKTELKSKPVTRHKDCHYNK